MKTVTVMGASFAGSYPGAFQPSFVSTDDEACSRPSPHLSPRKRGEGRRKKEEGRGKREEGRRKEEGGRRKEEGRKEGGRRKGYAPR
ncbi:MAG: hypothetical protein ACAH24_06985 [Hyphomicrobiaceae bacterium]